VTGASVGIGVGFVLVGGTLTGAAVGSGVGFVLEGAAEEASPEPGHCSSSHMESNLRLSESYTGSAMTTQPEGVLPAEPPNMPSTLASSCILRPQSQRSWLKLSAPRNLNRDARGSPFVRLTVLIDPLIVKHSYICWKFPLFSTFQD